MYPGNLLTNENAVFVNTVSQQPIKIYDGKNHNVSRRRTSKKIYSVICFQQTLSKKMKKRACRHYCSLCNLSFETWDRYSTHVLSRGHHANELGNAAHNVLLVSDEQFPGDLVEDNKEELFGWNTNYFELGNGEFDLPSSDENDLSASDILSEASDASANIAVGKDPALSYYPFPSEIFFLLYSYAHNTSRPKVTHINVYSYVYCHVFLY